MFSPERTVAWSALRLPFFFSFVFSAYLSLCLSRCVFPLFTFFMSLFLTFSMFLFFSSSFLCFSVFFFVLSLFLFFFAFLFPHVLSSFALVLLCCFSLSKDGDRRSSSRKSADGSASKVKTSNRSVADGQTP